LATCAGSQPTSIGGISANCGDTFFANQTRIGRLIGAGIEHFFAKDWSVKVEYDYMDFGRRSVLFTDGEQGFFTEEIHQKVNVVKVGIDYHFDFRAAAPSGSVSGSIPLKAKALDDPVERVLAFAVVDVSKQSVSSAVGTLIAPYKDLDTSGLRILLLGEGGTYKYPTDTGAIRGVYSGGDFLAGYAWEGDNYSINLLTGINALNHTLSAIDTENRVQGTAIGAKVRGDAWINPTPKTLTYGEAEYSTAFKTFYTRAKLGYDPTAAMGIFVGPEVVALGDERFHQWRAGAHLTQLKMGRVQIDISAGYAKDSIVGSGAYGTMELNTNF